MTAYEWLTAHDADQAVDEIRRPVRDESELYDSAHEADRAADEMVQPDEDEQLLETAILEVRDVTVREVTRDVDAEDRPHPDRGRDRRSGPSSPGSARRDRGPPAVRRDPRLGGGRSRRAAPPLGPG